MKNTGRVLLVDDDPRMLRLYERALAANGYTVATAESGQIAAARLSQEAFDVVISDVVMPGLDGVGLLQRVRAHDLDTPVIIMTSSPELAAAVKAVEWGAMRYLLKPVSLNALETSVAEAVHLRALARFKRELLVSLGSPELEAGDRAGREQQFTRALSSVWMAYQPIVSWRDANIYAYEALLRSNEPALERPEALVDAAVRLGKLHLLGRAIRQSVARNLSDAPPTTRVFVNLHPHDLLDDLLYGPEEPLGPFIPRVVFEITERAALDKVDRVGHRMELLRRRGFEIAVDDLGAGYSGLSSFVALEPSIVKLDMCLVRDIDQKPVVRRLVESIASVCREMGKKIVAEGVETVAERDVLVDCGCDLLQGYLFARPAPGFCSVSFPRSHQVAISL
jgi:EAL domain-containing protein (putative c-di-GMP-specific phosphodiesterase class I)